jgi:hypothetical protein
MIQFPDALLARFELSFARKNIQENLLIHFKKWEKTRQTEMQQKQAIHTSPPKFRSWSKGCVR